jgi:hypothetical protein
MGRNNADFQNQILFHGTSAELLPGDVVLPAKSIGVTPNWSPAKSANKTDVAYATPHRPTAEYFAGIAAIGGKTSNVYEVEPIDSSEATTHVLGKTETGNPIHEVRSKKGFKVIGNG